MRCASRRARGGGTKPGRAASSSSSSARPASAALRATTSTAAATGGPTPDRRPGMPVKLHRCKFEWLKTGACWRVEKALREMHIDYELAPGPSRPSKREDVIANTGQMLYPAIEFENGTWYREESRDMARTIRAGTLLDRSRPT